MAFPALEPTPPDLIDKTAGDVMVRQPKILPIDTSVEQAHACFTDDHVHMLLLAESGRLMGTLLRSDLRVDLDGAEPALTHSRMPGRTVPVDTPAEQVLRLLRMPGQRRLAVVDDEDTLLGLLCLKRRLTGFCSDTDTAARATEREARVARTQPPTYRQYIRLRPRDRERDLQHISNRLDVDRQRTAVRSPPGLAATRVASVQQGRRAADLQPVRCLCSGPVAHAPQRATEQVILVHPPHPNGQPAALGDPEYEEVTPS